MRTKTKSSVIALGLSLATLPLAGPAMAQAVSPRDQQARLEQRSARIESELGQKTGGMQRAELLKQRHEIEDAIKQLQSGRSVSTEDVDRILGETSVVQAR